ncbi:MAG: hypothetical protein KAR35_08290, partial [Candidatus Heimdallarchaeota archaeon]|nr:hypothetical protein [Candidatus Heimdallarchaeota archaeon]MCK5049357.1 hypothetical protein [Candidatus Heimdallarchaeota archaeon]
MTKPYGDLTSISKDTVKEQNLPFGIILTIPLLIGLMFLIESNFSSPSLLFSLFLYLCGLFIFALLCRLSLSKLKVFFIAIPLYLLLIGGMAFVFTDSSFNFFTPLNEHKTGVLDLLDSISAVPSSSDFITEDDIKPIRDYHEFFFAIDLIFAFLSLTFFGLGFIWLIQTIKDKRYAKVTNILSLIFSSLMIVIGVIILPYLWIGMVGTADFMTSYGSGAVYIYEGFDHLSTGDAEAAEPYFRTAEIYFEEARDKLAELQKYGFFTLFGKFQKDMGIYADNFENLASVTLTLTGGLVPFISGLKVFQQGIEDCVEALNVDYSGLQLLSVNDPSSELNWIDPIGFSHGINRLEASFDNFTIALDEFRNALVETEAIDWVELRSANGAENIEEQLILIEEVIPLLNTIIDMFEVIISPHTFSNGTISPYSVISHSMYGSLALTEARNKVSGGTTAYDDTQINWQQASNNFSVIEAALENEAFTQIDENDYSDEGLQEFITNYNGAIEFLNDTTDIGLEITEFGQEASNVMNSFITTLEVFDEGDFKEIDELTLDAAISNMSQTILSTENMLVIGTSLETKFDIIDQKTNADEYGDLFGEAATELTSGLLKFEPVNNSRNLNYLAKGLHSLFYSVEDLQNVDISLNDTVTLYETMNDSLPADILADIPGAATTMTTSIPLINNSIENAKNNLSLGSYHIGHASANFTLITEEMTQLKTSAASLSVIQNELEFFILPELTIIQSDLNTLLVAAEASDGVAMITALDVLHNDLDEDQVGEPMYNINS